MQQMQEVSEASNLEDDMAAGDLGDGMGVRVAAPISARKKSQTLAGVTESLLLMLERRRRRHSGLEGEESWIPGLLGGDGARWKLPHLASMADLSKEELKDRLQEAAEVIDVLCTELEVTHRYLEGKYEALKILQGKAILDKATGHTQSLLQKSEDMAKALEKEVNSLQWELSFSQVQMKKSQHSWEQKYNRILSENKTMSDSLEEKESEIQQLRAEHSALSRQCLELISMLNVKEQKAYEETKPQYSPEREASILEMAVLGACRCLGVPEACPCSRAAAASRKQLMQLQQELDAQRTRREEAVMVADAFRIAFEQQLRKRSEHFLLLAEANILKSNHCKAEGANRSPLISVSQRLKGLLPSNLDVNMPHDLLETLYRLLDLLNDKEEALAHQRKVSIMLAHSAEMLQRQLHLDSHCHSLDPPETRMPPQLPQDQLETKIPPKLHQDPPESRIPSKPQQALSEMTIPSKLQQEQSDTKIHLKLQQDSMEIRIPSKLQQDQSETRNPSKPQHALSETRIPSKLQQDPSETRIPLKPPHDPSQSRIPSKLQKDPSETRVPSILPQDLSETSVPLKLQQDPKSKTRTTSKLLQDRSETRIPTKLQQDPSKTRIPSKLPQDQPETRIPLKLPRDQSGTRVLTKLQQDQSRTRITSKLPQDRSDQVPTEDTTGLFGEPEPDLANR